MTVAQFGIFHIFEVCKVLFQIWAIAIPYLILEGVRLTIVARFSYLGRFLSKDVGDHACIQSMNAVCLPLHLWRPPDISLKLKGRMYCAAVHPIVL